MAGREGVAAAVGALNKIIRYAVGLGASVSIVQTSIFNGEGGCRACLVLMAGRDRRWCCHTLAPLGSAGQGAPSRHAVHFVAPRFRGHRRHESGDHAPAHPEISACVPRAAFAAKAVQIAARLCPVDCGPRRAVDGRMVTGAVMAHHPLVHVRPPAPARALSLRHATRRCPQSTEARGPSSSIGSEASSQ